MNTQTSPFSYLQLHQNEFLVLKELLRSENDKMNVFILDDQSHIRDITSLSDQEILDRLNLVFESQLCEDHLNMPLIALIDYLF